VAIPTQVGGQSEFTQATAALTGLQLSLPAGISPKVSFAVTSTLGVFDAVTDVAGEGAVAQALFLREMLNDAERVALMLGAPAKGAENCFAGQGLCVQYPREAVRAFVLGVRELFLTYGDVEINRVSLGHLLDVSDIARSTTTQDLGLAANGVVQYASRSPLLQLLCRAGCIDQSTRCEYPRLDAAEFMRSYQGAAVDGSTALQPSWTLVEASSNPPDAAYARRVSSRSMAPLEVAATI
jgi:hypothetical protein